uniref:Uncharacterized protein n=1 Tax=Fagus sylvatica TaxID=28930 RepID=A0A2N9FHT0_FAGSY
MGRLASSWLRAAVGLELGSELVVEGGAMGLEVELVVELMVDRSLDLRSKPAQIRIRCEPVCSCSCHHLSLRRARAPRTGVAHDCDDLWVLICLFLVLMEWVLL